MENILNFAFNRKLEAPLKMALQPKNLHKKSPRILEVLNAVFCQFMLEAKFESKTV
jgi:hypothetical protein